MERKTLKEIEDTMSYIREHPFVQKERADLMTYAKSLSQEDAELVYRIHLFDREITERVEELMAPFRVLGATIKFVPTRDFYKEETGDTIGVINMPNGDVMKVKTDEDPPSYESTL